MGGFPIHWEEEVQSLDQSAVCPYSTDKIEQYLWSCHYHWMLHEEPMRYKVHGVVAERTDGGRHFWLHRASDEVGREWYVVVGSGTSPFKPSQENDLSLTPDHFLKEEIGEQHVADAR